MGAFTHFFKAEAQVSKHRQYCFSKMYKGLPHCVPPEELAIHKEAHAFAQLVHAEHNAEDVHLRTRSRHLTLDNRRHQQGQAHHADPKRSRVPGHFARPLAQQSPATIPPTTMAQLIAEVSSNAAAILHSPPAPTPPASDHRPNVDDIIAAT